ncbi:DUF4190 domain-containing protein [Citricoccus parietis]|uniref:DUF4190 domain-containing protein n=1 Tax=Citricoccus parietis TaxID=592307 RepID=A0ABV6F082_9MICC
MPPAQTMPPTKRTNGVGIAALVVGIIAILLSLIPVVGIIIGVAAVVLGIIGLVLKNRAKGMAIAGLILGAVAVIVSIIATVIAGAFINEVDQQMNTEHTIEYKATVSTGAASASYGTIEGQSTADFEGEWTESATVTGFDAASLTITGDPMAEDQELTCEIIVNGESVTTQTGTSIVTCSGSTMD